MGKERVNVESGQSVTLPKSDRWFHAGCIEAFWISALHSILGQGAAYEKVLGDGAVDTEVFSRLLRQIFG